jgi:hypothetical protein
MHEHLGVVHRADQQIRRAGDERPQHPHGGFVVRIGTIEDRDDE